LQQVLAEALGRLDRHHEALPILADLLQANARWSDATFSPERVRILRALARGHAAVGDEASARSARAEAGAIASRHGQLGPPFEPG
jgi:predicted Zn-dependent protease